MSALTLPNLMRDEVRRTQRGNNNAFGARFLLHGLFNAYWEPLVAQASYVVQPRSGVLLASGVEKAVDTGP